MGECLSFQTETSILEIENLSPRQQACRVLQGEAEALNILSNSLNNDFDQAIHLLLKTQGRVVVSGIGKSGHIARKISATLASTGTPSFFIHPAEASHGDLGMISRQDSLIVLSNSGETTELSDLITYSRRAAIPLIAMTQKGSSTLAQASNIALILPQIEEACPMGLAPTTSTTMMLALGDALAICLLNSKRFSAVDFKNLHPGGQLGQKLMRVGDIMHKGDQLPLVEKITLMSETLVTMTAKTFGCAGVLDEQGQICGIITDGDLRRHMDSDLLRAKAEDVMNSSPLLIRSKSLAAEALSLMSAQGITSLFVVDDDAALKPIGILHIHDCLRANLV